MTNKKQKPTHIVGIGASAGGLDPLEVFFDNVPAGSGMAFIVVQHLSPHFKSLMNELLDRHTTMKILHVQEEMEVEANTIYLIPPRQSLTLKDGFLHLRDADQQTLDNMPIDLFFRSLADECGDKGIAIILSGSGSDGSRSLKSVSEKGVLIMAQSPESASFDSMPRSAIDTKQVDLVLLPEAMPAAIMDHRRESLKGVVDPKRLGRYEIGASGDYKEAFMLLRNYYGVDFNYYKPTTVERRIERRMGLLGFKSFDSYLMRLGQDEEELSQLYHDLLIGVTEFFRDKEAFAALQSEVIPKIVEESPHKELRVWVCGCATGEEAYSVAIAINEFLEKEGINKTFKVFATDTHRESLAAAGQGVYAAEALESLSARLVGKYFVQEGNLYRVTKNLRRCIIFSEHNILSDPPFTKIDLVTCRNMLIYFQIVAQKKAISMLHFALRKDGVLFMGSSETLGDFAQEFDIIDNKWKLFSKRRESTSKLGTDSTYLLSFGKKRGNAGVHESRDISQNRILRAYDALLESVVPAGLLVTTKRELLHTFGDASKYLLFGTGRLSSDLMDLIKGELRVVLTAGLSKAIKSSQPVTYKHVTLQVAGSEAAADIEIRPLGDGSEPVEYLLIRFDEVTAATEKATDASSSDEMSHEELSDINADRIVYLERELKYSRDNLHTTVEELETSNEELQSTNEELIASNEELQSTNEELHSVNEELYTVNAEYERKNQELERMASDMENLFSSTRIGTLFLDKDLNIRKFTPDAVRLFKLLPQDIGRSITHIASSITQSIDWKKDIQQVIDSGEMLERNVSDEEGRDYLKRVLPYYKNNEEIEGAVITFFDIDKLKKTEKQLAKLNSQLEERVIERTHQLEYNQRINQLIIEATQVAVWELSSTDKSFSWEDERHLNFGYKKKEITTLSDWVERIHSKQRGRIHENVLAMVDGKKQLFSERIDFLCADGQYKAAMVWGNALTNNVGKVERIVGAMLDVSEIEMARQQVESQRRIMNDIMDSTDDAFVVVDKNYDIIYQNQANRLYTEKVLGKVFNEEENLLDNIREAGDDPEKARRTWGEGLKGNRVTHRETYGTNGNEKRIFVTTINPVKNHLGEIIGSSGLSRDITSELDAQERIIEMEREKTKLESTNEALAEFAYLASHDLQEPLRMITAFTGLFAEKYEATVDDEGKEYLTYIQDGARRMKALIESLLQYSRINTDQQKLDQINMMDAINDAQANLISRLEETQTTITVSDMPIIQADFQRMVQLWQNLIGNAVKFSNGRQPVIEIDCKEETDSHLFSISDNGIGIPADQLSRVFEIFHRLHTQSKYPGTGIGLATCKKIVQYHHGRIWAESEEDKGTTFFIRIPKEIEADEMEK